MAAHLAGDAVFVPGDPARHGMLALYDVPDSDADTTIELVLPTSKSVRRRAVPARLVPIDEAIPVVGEGRRRRTQT